MQERRLLNEGKEVRLTPKAFDLLALLVQQAGHLVEKDNLMNSIWPDAIVEEGNLTKTIHAIRKALNEDDNGNRFIENVPTRGYRFVADVESAYLPQGNGQVVNNGKLTTSEGLVPGRSKLWPS